MIGLILLAVISQIHGKCEKPIHESVAVFVPGEIFQWIMENEGLGKEISAHCLGPVKDSRAHLRLLE